MPNKTRVFKTATPAIVGLALALGGCSKEPQQASPDQVADQLNSAAAQSDPKAAAVINKRADELRGQESAAPPGEPGSYTQETMRQAGAAAAQSDAPAQ
jgi:PBP1b-binding outer membrane lipoprotein LpoB